MIDTLSVIYTASILAGVAVTLWLVVDVMKLWHAERYEKLKRWLVKVFRLGRSKQPAAEKFVTKKTTESTLDEAARRVRNEALGLAIQSLSSGSSVSEAVEDAVTHIGRHTKEWKNEGEVRRWITLQLSAQFNPGLRTLRMVKSNPWKICALGLVCGSVLGYGAAYFSANRYRVEAGGPSRVWMIRIDTWTGRSWAADFRNSVGDKDGNRIWYWKPINVRQP